MRKVVVFLLVVCALASIAAVQRYQSAAVESRSAGGPSYLISEDFEGAGTPGSLGVVGAPNFDYTTSPAPLVGSESLLNSSTSNYATAALGGVTERWFYFLFTHPDISVNPHIFRVLDAGGNTILGGRITSTGAMRTTNVTTTLSTGSAGAYTAGTTKHCWIHILQSASATSDVIEIFVSDTATKPASASGTDGVTSSSFDLTDTDAFSTFTFYPGVSTSYIVDKFRVDDVNIGSSPP
jgi:hypothetical protein